MLAMPSALTIKSLEQSSVAISYNELKETGNFVLKEKERLKEEEQKILRKRKNKSNEQNRMGD